MLAAAVGGSEVLFVLILILVILGILFLIRRA